jgi:hypothetical protein
MVRSETGFICCLKHRATRDGDAVGGSRSTRNRSRLTGEKKWLYAAVDTDSKLLLEIDVFSRRGTDPAAFTRTAFSCSPPEIFDF